MKALIFSAAIFFVLCSPSSVHATLVVIDNNDAGYSEIDGDPLSSGWASSSSFAPNFNEDVRYSQKPGDAAIWSFGGLGTGTYEVYATWAIHATGATTLAKYTISDGGGEASVSQQTLAANDLSITDDFSELHSFQFLGTATVSDGTLEVTLTNANAGGALFADAIAITAPEPATLVLIACGAVGIIRKRRNR